MMTMITMMAIRKIIIRMRGMIIAARLAEDWAGDTSGFLVGGSLVVGGGDATG